MASVRHLEFEKFRFFLSNFHARNGNSYLCTKFDRNRLIHGWDMEIKLYFFQNGVRPPSWICIISIFLLKFHHGNWDVHLPTKFDRNRIILGWDNGIFKMAAVRHLEFAKIAVLVTWPISACDPSSPFQISCWSVNMAQRYSQKQIFNMAMAEWRLRHIGFVMHPKTAFHVPNFVLNFHGVRFRNHAYAR